MAPDEVSHGYLIARHVFGRSHLVRSADTHYLLWQWSEKKSPFALINLDHKTYHTIKEMLLPVKRFHEFFIDPHNESSAKAIVYYHATNAKTYAKVRRFLKKNQLIKED